MISESDYSSREKDMTVKVRNHQHPLEASRAYIPFYTSIMADLVKIIGGDAGLELCRGDVQYFPS